jgi:hypothetical protein
MIPSPSPVFQFFKADGTPAAGYLIKTYLAGTTTDADTYQDAAGNTLHTNPIELDVNGMASIFVDPSIAYKYVLQTENEAAVETWDNIKVYNPLSSRANYDQETVTLSQGVATATQTMAKIDTEGGAASDDLSIFSVEGAQAGDLAFISSVSPSRKVVVQHGTAADNIALSSSDDFPLPSGNWLPLRYTGVYWEEFAPSTSMRIIYPQGESLPTSDKGPIWHYDSLSFMIWQSTEYKSVLNMTDIASTASSAEAAAGTVDTKFLTPLKLRNGLNATGSAPVFACRAWVRFNGTGTLATVESGNVSSVTDNNTGDYTVNFATALPDVNYAVISTCGGYQDANAPTNLQVFNDTAKAPTASAVRLFAADTNSTNYRDVKLAYVAIFR